MYLADDAPPTAKPETMEEHDARRTRNVMLVFGVVVGALFYFGYKSDPVRDVTGRKRDGTF